MLALVGGLIFEVSRAARETRDQIRHSNHVIGAVKDLDLALRDAETGQRGYLLTGDDADLGPYSAALTRLGVLQDLLQGLTADDPLAQDRLRDLGPRVRRKLDALARSVDLRRAGAADPAVDLVRTAEDRTLMQAIEGVLGSMTTDEDHRLADHLKVGDRRGILVRGLAGFGTVLAVGGLLWAAWLLNQAWARSSRIEAEQRSLALRLQTSFDSLSQGLAVFDGAEALAQWNGCFAALLALPAETLRIGTPYATLVEATGRGGPPLLETPEQLRQAAPQADGVVTYERAAAEARHLEVRRTAMRDGGFVLTITDVTDRAAAETMLRDAQKMQAIGQLTGGIAHDFNNLLTVILGNLEVVRARLGLDHPLQTRVARAVWAAERGATLTSQLLAFARKQPLAPRPLDLTAVIPQVVPMLRRSLGETIHIRYVESAGVWPAMADQTQLESAVLNLALNARDAMPDGGRLTIALANEALDAAYCRQHAEVEPGDYAMVAVSDTGQGMTPDIQARAFEPFFTTKVDGKGTGLGLAMVFGFVKQSGGHVRISSEPGEGTTIRLYLPRATGVAGGVARGRAAVALPRGAATVLVVEDEPAVREIACTMLSELGYRVLEAADGEEGLRVFEAHAARIELLLTDVVLPGARRGRDLAARVQAIRPGTKVLYLSGDTDDPVVHVGRPDEGAHLLGKPLHRDELALKLAEVMGARADPVPGPGLPREG